MKIHTPASRAADPVSSHLAEQEINETGVRDTQQHQVLYAVRKTPGLTARELARVYGFDRYMVSRRLPELEPTHIRRGEMRKCQVGGRQSVTWWPI